MDYFNFIKNIEINPTELCNLKCTFCPRADGYPNQNLHMNLETAKEIRKNLDTVKFSKIVTFAGRGEPTLTQDFASIISIFIENNPTFYVDITTNGKKIETLRSFFNNRLVSICFDVYDTDRKVFDEYVEKYSVFNNIRLVWKPDIGVKYDRILYDHIKKNKDKTSHDGRSVDGFTNRGGFLGDPVYDIEDKGCAKLIYNLFIDWNGNYNLCCDDWNPLVLGNIFSEPLEDFVNYNETLSYYRKKHFCENSRSGLPACENCNRNAPIVPDVKQDVQKLLEIESLI